MDISLAKNWMDFGFTKFLISGAIAGTVVDVALFPIDAIKTRMQSENGFWRSGGFYGIYRGIAPAAAGSAPTAAIFFWSYESCKQFLSSATGSRDSVLIQMVSASIAEISACLIRVPVEIAKQRRQVLNCQINKSALDILLTSFKKNGIRKGIYRGYCSTLCREIPFSFIQFPLWEFLKFKCSARTGAPISPFFVAACGAVAGGVSAAITTPLDVAKTRIMLCDETGGQKLGIRNILILIYNEKGVKGLFSGLVPRVMWITLGGAIFFGFYDLTLRQL